MPKKNKEAGTPPINILHTHLSASFCFAKTCQSLQVMDAKKNKEARMPPIKYSFSHLSESFLLCKKLSFISRQGCLEINIIPIQLFQLVLELSRIQRG